MPSPMLDSAAVADRVVEPISCVRRPSPGTFGKRHTSLTVPVSSPARVELMVKAGSSDTVTPNSGTTAWYEIVTVTEVIVGDGAVVDDEPEGELSSPQEASNAIQKRNEQPVHD